MPVKIQSQTDWVLITVENEIWERWEIPLHNPYVVVPKLTLKFSRDSWDLLRIGQISHQTFETLEDGSNTQLQQITRDRAGNMWLFYSSKFIEGDCEYEQVLPTKTPYLRLFLPTDTN